MKIEVVQIPIVQVEVKATGSKGQKGTNGKSAYELWLGAGHTGTLEDFFAYGCETHHDDDDSADFVTVFLNSINQ